MNEICRIVFELDGGGWSGVKSMDIGNAIDSVVDFEYRKPNLRWSIKYCSHIFTDYNTIMIFMRDKILDHYHVDGDSS